jgi:hypothetical protein
MSKRRMKIANLDEAGLKKVQQMEDSMGTLIIALEPHIPLAELTEEQVETLNALEQQLGVVLIAYQK